MTQPPSEIVVGARAAAKKYGIPASITIAQWALESGWGQHVPLDSFNPFGMKAKPGQPSITVATREVYRGVSVIVNAAFRKFTSFADALDAHAKLLATAPVYGHARACLPDPFKFADALTGTYATDPKYGELLGSIIRGSNLTRYDNA